MKKSFTIIAAILFNLALLAQSPQKMSYQAVIRDSSNILVTSRPVGMRISILKDATPVYVETQKPTTNANGLATIEMGGGTPVTGTFAGIDWSTGVYFLKSETDPTGGTNYTILGTSQLLSVPYALYSKNSASSNDAVRLTGNQTIAGNKTFSGTTSVITPVNANDAATKAYVDALIEQLYAQGALRVRDYDGNYYNTIKIGNQIWMSENLKTTKYNDGTAIPNIIDNTTWAALATGAYCDYSNTPANSTTYGRLYNWFTVDNNAATKMASNGGKNVCPTGWHVPSEVEWTTLTDYLTNNGYGYEGSGNDIAKSMASTSGWTAYGTLGTVGNDQASNNRSGFTALPSGFRNLNGVSGSVGNIGYWWSSSKSATSATIACSRYVSYSSSSISTSILSKHYGFSVRCLRD